MGSFNLNTVFIFAGFGLLFAYVATMILSPALLTIVLMYGFPCWAAGFCGWQIYYDSKIGVVSNPYWDCKGNPTKTLLLFLQKNGRARMRSDANYIAQVYEIEDEKKSEMMAFSKNEKGAFKLGEAIMEIVYDGANMTLAPEWALAIEALKKKGFTSIDKLQDAIEKGAFRTIVDDEIGITLTFNKEPEKGQIYIPLFKTINPHELIGYVLGSANIFKGYVVNKISIERLKNMKQGLQDPMLQKWALFFVILAVGLVIMKAGGVF